METEKLEELRKWRGRAIAKNSHIVRLSENEWAVPSQTRTCAYTVRLLQDRQTCSCPDFAERGLKCKHLFAVENIKEKQKQEREEITYEKQKNIQDYRLICRRGWNKIWI